MKKPLFFIFGQIVFVISLTAAVFAQNADLQRGIELIEKEDYKAAIAALGKCAAAADVSVKSACLQKRGLAFERSSDFLKAKADFNAAVRVNPTDETAYFARARFRINHEGAAAALPDFNQVIKLNPQNAEAFFFRGQIHSEGNYRAKAVADFSEAIRLKNDYHQAVLLRAYEYLETGELDKAVADLTRYIELQPADYEGYFQRGAAFRRKGDKQKAEADYRAAIKLEPELPALKEHLSDLNLTKNEVVKKAEKLQKEENPLVAAAFLERFPEYGEDVEILYLKSVTNVEAGNYKAADVYFQKQFDSFFADARSTAAEGDEYAAKPKTAENAASAGLMYATAMISFGAADLVNSLRAVALEQNGVPAAKRNPKNLNNYAAFKKLYEEIAVKAGIAELDAGSLDLALQNFNKAVELNPRSKAAFENRAKVYRKQGKIRLAAADEAKAKRLPAQK